MTSVPMKESPSSEYKMLNLLLECAQKNAGKKPGAKRFVVVVKELSYLIFTLGGLGLYEILSYSDNFPLPSVSTIRRMIYSNESFVEGSFRIKLLKEFLLKHDLPLVVFVCEDATRIAGRIQYHSFSNSVVGFTLPLNSNGLPMVGFFRATSASKIAEYFANYPASSYAYCIIAVPMKVGAPSFCICMFGTDNRFKGIDVQRRIEWTAAEIRKEGVEVVGFGSDGDPRLLSVMCAKTIVDKTPSGWKWFSAKQKVKEIFVQDHIHVGTKLKTCLLKPSVILPMGRECLVSRGHLVDLIKSVSKDQHQLCESLINPKDKMNYRAVQLISDKKVTSLLRSEICQSEATAVYLDLMREVVEAYTRPDLTPLQRVEMIWMWVFFLRMWRKWISDQEDYKVSCNFITLNTYSCIEINAHSLIQLIIMFRDSELHHLFLPWKCTSQDCESKFRELRSSVASHCGVVSFSILELQTHFRRLDALTETYANLRKVFTFPRHQKAARMSEADAHIPVCLPENYEIKNSVMSALQKAVVLAKQFRLISAAVQPSYIPVCHLKERFVKDIVLDHDPDDEEIDFGIVDDGLSDEESDAACEEDKEDDLHEVTEDLFIVSTGSLGVRKYNDVALREDSPYVLVGDGFGEPAIILKSTLCYLLSSGDTKLSSDRLKRAATEIIDHSKTALARKQKTKSVPQPHKEETVHLTDWCAFKSEDGSIAVGKVWAFSYLSGTSISNRAFSPLSAPTKPPEKNARGLGCLCTWFSLKRNSPILHATRMDTHGYYSMEYYICTLPRPLFKNNQWTLTCNVRDILRLKNSD